MRPNPVRVATDRGPTPARGAPTAREPSYGPGQTRCLLEDHHLAEALTRPKAIERGLEVVEPDPSVDQPIDG